MDEKLNLKRWIELKASEIILQMIIVVFSIVLALTVDEWRSSRSQKELAEQAYTSVLNELKENRKELTDGLTSNDSILIVVARQLKTKLPQKSGIPFAFSQLSSAAWQTSQTTQTIHLVNFQRLIKIAQVYEIQTLYQSLQTKFINEIGESWVDGSEERMRTIWKKGGVQLALLNQIGHELVKQYSTILSDSTTVITN